MAAPNACVAFGGPDTINTPLFGPPHDSPTPKPGILDIAPYVGGRSGAPGAAKVFKLSSNESALGPSPKAVESPCRGRSMTWRFIPDGAAREPARGDRRSRMAWIRRRIVRAAKVPVPLLTLLANAYLQPGDEAIFGRHAFLVYEIVTLANSAKPVIVPERATNSGIKLDVDAMLARGDAEDAAGLYATPNNSTGSHVT